jgi:hypothetical protein
MISLRPDCLMIQMSSGDTIPCSAEVATVELLGDAAHHCEPEIVRNAAQAVLHYFKTQLGRETVSIKEFSQALVKVLRGFGLQVSVPEEGVELDDVESHDLQGLAASCEQAQAYELEFFPRLRCQLRERLSATPRSVRFVGLKSCVRTLIRTRRWGRRCESLQTQIVGFLRDCLTEESARGDCSLEIRP